MEESEFFCNDYDWELFFRVSNKVIPDILRKAYIEKIPFCVIGGKAVDAHTAQPAYSQNYIGSPDWDIDSSERDIIVDFIIKKIKNEIPSIHLFTKKVVKEVVEDGEKISYKGVQIGIIPPSMRVTTEQTPFEIRNCALPFVADVFQKPGFRVEVIEGIPYIPARRLIVDLIGTIQDRKVLVTGAEGMLIRYEDTEKQMIKLKDTIQTSVIKLKRGINRALTEVKPSTDEIIERYTEDIIDYAEQLGKLSVTPHRHDFISHHKGFLHTIEKLKRTQQRLGEMKKVYGGAFAMLCRECATEIEHVIDGVSCQLINQNCPI